MNRRNALSAGHDEGGRNWARFASLIGTCRMNGVDPCSYLRDLFTRLAGGHLARDIDALMPRAYVRQGKDACGPRLVVPDELPAASAPHPHDTVQAQDQRGVANACNQIVRGPRRFIASS